MTTVATQEGKKWIQTAVALTCMVLAYILISFFEKIAEWFPLESMIPYYFGVTQAFSVISALGVFLYIMKSPKTSIYLSDVYAEALKVVWPDRQQTWRHTIVIMIGVTIVGFVLGFFDFGASYLLSLIHK